MRIGPLRKRVQIQAATETLDSRGQPIPTWTTVATAWAQVRPLSGAEALNVKQVWATATHSVTLRFNPAVPLNPKLRLVTVQGGRVLNLLSTLNADERNRMWQCLAEERTPAT